MNEMRQVSVWMVGLLMTVWSEGDVWGAEKGAWKFELKDGDRVVFVGNTIIERMGQWGYVESMLTRRFAGKKVIYRNLGWSGDTVFGHSRGYFGPASEGYKRLMKHVSGLKPTVMFVGYGTNAAFKGQAGLAEYLGGLKRLLDDFDKTGAKIVLVGPNRLEYSGPRLPKPDKQNENVRIYSEAMGKVAGERGYKFINLYKDMARFGGRRLTYNGLHLSGWGYYRMAKAMEVGLGLGAGAWGVKIDTGKEKATGVGVSITSLSIGARRVTFEAKDEVLAWPRVGGSGEARVIQVKGLPTGQYWIQVDGKWAAGKLSSEDLARGVSISRYGGQKQANALRAAINKKNELYFHRWRPANETYLFGFRKHEQGNNAAEMPKFDPLVAKKEEEIRELSKPGVHVYKILPMKRGE